MYNLLLKAGKLCKSFFVWAWNVDDISEFIAGSLLILLTVACGVFIFMGLVWLVWLTFNVNWLWIFSWPPAVGLVTFGEIRVIKGIIGIYEDFFV